MVRTCALVQSIPHANQVNFCCCHERIGNVVAHTSEHAQTHENVWNRLGELKPSNVYIPEKKNVSVCGVSVICI
jgi:hypothetical protein